MCVICAKAACPGPCPVHKGIRILLGPVIQLVFNPLHCLLIWWYFVSLPMMMLWETLLKSSQKLRSITLGMSLLNLLLLDFSLTKMGGGDIFLYNVLHIEAHDKEMGELRIIFFSVWGHSKLKLLFLKGKKLSLPSYKYVWHEDIQQLSCWIGSISIIFDVLREGRMSSIPVQNAIVFYAVRI